jgi:hypothetical protein
MVKIIKTKISQNSEGKPFVSLKLQGEPEFVQSQQTGRMYLTAKTCYVTSTFDEATANALIGKELPGTVERVPSEPYEYKVESTGELIVLAHRYEYKPEPTPVPVESLVQPEVIPQYSLSDELADTLALHAMKSKKA